MGATILEIHGSRDDLGRCSFTLEWEQPGGVFRHEIHFDGEPVGFRRGQCFFAVPEDYEVRARERGEEIVRGTCRWSRSAIEARREARA